MEGEKAKKKRRVSNSFVCKVLEMDCFQITFFLLYRLYSPKEVYSLLRIETFSLLILLHNEKGIVLIQPILSSSYNGYGNAFLDQDVSELRELVKVVKEKAHRIFLFGFSTGCQISLSYLKRYAEDISGLILLVL